MYINLHVWVLICIIFAYIFLQLFLKNVFVQIFQGGGGGNNPTDDAEASKPLAADMTHLALRG